MVKYKFQNASEEKFHGALLNLAEGCFYRYNIVRAAFAIWATATHVKLHGQRHPQVACDFNR